MKRFLALSTPIGLILYFVYTIVHRFLWQMPDIVAYPMMIISIVFMLIGIAYNGYCFGKRKNPYDFK